MSFDRRQGTPPIQSIEDFVGKDFEGKFRRLFHRDMTPDERRFFELASVALDSQEQDDEAAA
jgi:hypothetical protein